MVFSRRIESEQKEKKWKRVIGDWEGSDFSIVKYCRLHNLTKHQFFYWKRKLEGPSRTLSVVPLQINTGADLNDHSMFTVVISDRYKIEINSRFDPVRFRQVVEVLSDL